MKPTSLRPLKLMTGCAWIAICGLSSSPSDARLAWLIGGA